MSFYEIWDVETTELSLFGLGNYVAFSLSNRDLVIGHYIL